MVHRWQCDECGQAIWSSNEGLLRKKVKSHLFDHHTGRVSKVDFKLSWQCPRCGSDGSAYDTETGVTEFKNHLYKHVQSGFVSGTHIADSIGGNGNVLVETPVESDSADNMRRHFLPIGDVNVLVTNNPEERVRLLDETLDEWPAWTSLITTKRRPLSEPIEIDFADIPIEVVQLDRSLGPDSLGETISRVVEAQSTVGDTVVFEFDILPEMIRAFNLRRAYSFLQALSSRLDDADALSLFYLDPDAQSSTLLNLIDGEFDMQLSTDGSVFTATP
jgi:rubredoxin